MADPGLGASVCVGLGRLSMAEPGLAGVVVARPSLPRSAGIGEWRRPLPLGLRVRFGLERPEER